MPESLGFRLDPHFDRNSILAELTRLNQRVWHEGVGWLLERADQEREVSKPSAVKVIKPFALGVT